MIGHSAHAGHGAPDELADFPVVIALPVQWGDQDAFGHVNNTIPIRWFESSRIAYLEHSGMGLLFERFLSENREEWPDIDVDLPSGDEREASDPGRASEGRQGEEAGTGPGASLGANCRHPVRLGRQA